ncbi:MAG: TonB-dependent receptor [Bacteroides sp.]|nr:TonB-dependent receptor [Bacteroides sp.]
MKKLRLTPIICLSAMCATTWAATVKGRIADGDGEPLPGAAIQLIALPDTVRAGYQMAGDNGDFIFQNVKPGQYALIASMTGMDDIGRNVEIKDSAEVVDLGNITLSENAIMLNEAVVTAIKTAVVAKQDTIEFNAGSFHTSPNATVNDLLKKLPGVEVGSDGSITSNGKTITKILVDGKEFFGDDPQMATKNLPSNMVDKVQVVDRKSDLARLTGVDDGEEETVINLTVKKDMNNGWFGNVSGGYGTDDRYQGSFIINNFNNGNQITILGGLNNINEQGFSDRGRGRFRDFGANGGITTAQRLGLNFNVGNEEIFRIGGNILYSHTDQKSTRKTATQYLFPDSVSTQDAGSKARDKGHNINSDFRIQWKPNENNTFEFRPRLSLNFRESMMNDSSLLRAGDPQQSRVNRNTNAKTNKGTSIETSGNLIYNHNFASKPGRSFSVNAQYSFSNTRQKSTTWSEIEYFLLQDNDEELYRFIDNHTWSNSVEGRLTWTEPLGDPKKGNFLNIAYRLKYQWNNADKLTYNLDNPDMPEGFIPPELTEAPAGSVFDADLSNSFRNTFSTQELQLGYRKVSKTINLDAGVLFSPSSSKSEDLINDARNIPERWVWNVSPYANLRYKFGERSSIRVNYRARTSQPSMTQLQPVADVSDPLNVVIGNPELKPTFTQNIGIHFNDFRSKSQQALFAVVNASFAINSVVARTVTDRETGGRTTTYSNVNGNFNIFGMAMINRPFRNRKWRFNARMNARFGSTPGYINGDFNRTGNLNLSPAAGLTFSSDIFQMSVNPTYSFGNVTNTLPEQPSRTTHAYGFNSDLSLYLPFGVEFTTDLNFSSSSGYSQGFNSNQWLWNAQLSYSFLSDKSLTFSVRAYDLLGQKKNISRSVSANTIVDSWFNDLTRYVMFGLTWNFNTLKKKGKGPDGESDMMMPPPGGPGGRPMGPPPGGFGRRP